MQESRINPDLFQDFSLMSVALHDHKVTLSSSVICIALDFRLLWVYGGYNLLHRQGTSMFLVSAVRSPGILYVECEQFEQFEQSVYSNPMIICVTYTYTAKNSFVIIHSSA